MLGQAWGQRRWQGAAIAAVAAMMVGTGPAPAATEGPFAAFTGAWSGSGQVRFSGGSSELLKCKAYYTPKEAGASLGIAIMCASPGSRIELRANLAHEQGRVRGQWEERTFHATGAVNGKASGNRLTLAIEGGGFSGSMAVGLNGASQSVSIETSGIGMTGVTINLSRG